MATETITQDKSTSSVYRSGSKTIFNRTYISCWWFKRCLIFQKLWSTICSWTRVHYKHKHKIASGLGGFQPFLQTAAARTGPQAYQAFMSPYQRDVISTHLEEFDIQAQKGLGSISNAQAIQAGAFGGGREGVAQAEYLWLQSDRNRAALQAQLLQQGFGQAQQAAQQNFANQMNLAQASSCIVRSTNCRFINFGAQQQAQAQAGLGAQQQLAQAQANQPYKQHRL